MTQMLLSQGLVDGRVGRPGMTLDVVQDVCPKSRIRGELPGLGCLCRGLRGHRLGSGCGGVNVPIMDRILGSVRCPDPEGDLSIDTFRRQVPCPEHGVGCTHHPGMETPGIGVVLAVHGLHGLQNLLDRAMTLLQDELEHIPTKVGIRRDPEVPSLEGSTRPGLSRRVSFLDTDLVTPPSFF